MMCHRVAPSATRTANSLRRAAALARSRFATLAQAISKTRPTAPKRIKSAGLTLPVMLSCRETSRTRWCPALARGYSANSCWEIVFISERAWANVMPGFSLPITLPASRQSRCVMFRGPANNHSGGGP